MLAACAAEPDLGWKLPKEFRLYLAFVHAENGRRNRALRRQLGHATACLNGVGIEPVLLKGAIRLVDGLYPDPSWRFMRDLDLLVPRDRLSIAVDRLRAAGYGWADGVEWDGRDTHLLPGLKRHDDAAIIELHAAPLSDLLQKRGLCPAEGMLARSRPVDLDGTRVRVPDVTDQLAHLIAHDQDDAEDLGRAGMFQLRSLFEAALLCREESPMPEVLARFASAGVRRWARVHLALTGHFFPDYVAYLSSYGIFDHTAVHALLGLERLDRNGALRRIFGTVRYKVGLLRRSSAYRGHVMASILSPGWYRRAVRRLHQRWAGG